MLRVNRLLERLGVTDEDEPTCVTEYEEDMLPLQPAEEETQLLWHPKMEESRKREMQTYTEDWREV